MAQQQLLNSLSELNAKIELLIENQKKLKQEIKELQIKNNMLEEMHQADMMIHSQDEKDIEFLTVSHRLANSPDTIISTRQKLIGLIRTINKCIRMLNEE